MDERNDYDRRPKHCTYLICREDDWSTGIEPGGVSVKGDFKYLVMCVTFVKNDKAGCCMLGGYCSIDHRLWRIHRGSGDDGHLV